jgi:uracil-DNA glycosylase
MISLFDLSQGNPSMKECHRCKDHGLQFRRKYGVAEFLEGYPDSPIWIIGLNPARQRESEDERSLEQLQNTFFDESRKVPYFQDFERVSSWLFSVLGTRRGAAHTDLIKCFGKSWPPKEFSRNAAKQVISNCKPFLQQQVSRYKPSLIVCNGADVCTWVLNAIPPIEPRDRGTSYRGLIDGSDVWVVLSGFIGRLDNYARARLGEEIERVAVTIGLKK